MDKLEKAERLRESAQVSYEDAQAALDACGGDLLDAMVLLEKQGKTQTQGRGVYSTSYREQETYIDVPDQVAQQKEAAPTLSKSLTRIFRTLIGFVKHTSFLILRHNEEWLRMPSWVMALGVLIFWKAVVPAVIISLLLGFRFTFESDDSMENTDAANSILSKAGELADDVKHEFQKGMKEKKNNS